MAVEAAENEVVRNLLDVGDKLLSPPSDVEDLLKLLNQAEDFLSQVKQAPPSSMNIALYRVMKALVTEDLLNHSEMDVKIALASCFSEITFIAAPSHPYNEDLMKAIFRIIVDALKNINDPSSRTYYKKVSILETIVKVHSCVLMLDLDCDDLILEIFQHFLKTIRPANEGRIFSLMEAVMTELINESEDMLLPHLLESLVNGIKDGLPNARRLGEKVIGNCAGKLKPYLIELAQSNGYGDIIASICQENYDISEINLPSTSGECLEPGRLEPEADSLKDMATPADESLKEMALSNATVQRRSCDSVITSSSVKLKPESYRGVGHSEIATVELDTQNSSIVVKSLGTVGSNIKKRRELEENSVVRLNDTTSHFQRHDDKALSVTSSRRDCIKEADCHSSKGASYNDQTKGEMLPEVEKLCQRTTWRSSRNGVERKLLEQKKLKTKQHMPNSILIKDLAREKISKNYAVAELVDVPSKKNDKTLDSEGTDRCGTSTKRSTRKATEIESLEHQKSKIEKQIGKCIIIDDLARQQSSKALIEDQYNWEESRLSSRTKSRAKRTRAIKEVSEAETREKEMDEELVGSTIKVWWPDDQEFYEGVVESFDPVSKKHKVSYFDGDEEILFLKDECWNILKDNTKKEFEWWKRKENSRTDASPNVLNMVKGKDPILEHCERLAGNGRWSFKCFHCSRIVSDLGRMKHHLARTGHGIVKPCTQASQEVEKLFREIVSQKKATGYVKSLDPTWEHCAKEAGYPSWKFKCVYCSKIVWGIRRMKYHLARANKISTPCSSCPKEVEDFFFNLISQLERRK